MRKNIILRFYLIVTSVFGQNYLNPNERIICSFETMKGKIVMLARDKDDKYIVYHFGSKTKTELEYPENKENSWSKFKFSYYSRGGGKRNDGMEINQISLSINGFKYFVYYHYRIVGNETNIGITIVDEKTKKQIDIEGKTKTFKGRIFEFRDNKKLKITEDDEL